MKSVSDAQRDSQRVWSYLDRLFDWAGNRNKPMPPSDLLEIRSQVTDSLNRLSKRADDLEKAPLLRLVEIDPEGMRTVTFDMRDGTTRKFQTRADWFDESPTIGDPVPAEVIELRDQLAEQVGETAVQAQLAALAQQEILVLRAEVEAARTSLGDKQVEPSGVSEEEVQARLRAAEELSDAKIKELEQDRDHWRDMHAKAAESVETWRERFTATTKTIEEIGAETSAASKTYSAEIVRLEVDRDEWKKRYLVAATVIDEALPAITDLLTEKTKELEDERRGIGGSSE